MARELVGQELFGDRRPVRCEGVEAWTAARGSTGPDDACGTHARRDKSFWRACDG